MEAEEYARRRGLPGFVLNSPNLALAYINEPSWPNCVTACDRFSRDWHAGRTFPLFAWSCLALGFFNGTYRPINQMSPREFDGLMKERWTSDVVRCYFGDRVRRASSRSLVR